jgi:hypothetical protein
MRATTMSAPLDSGFQGRGQRVRRTRGGNARQLTVPGPVPCLTHAGVAWIMPDVRGQARVTERFPSAAGRIFFSVLYLAAVVGGALAALWIGGH